MTFTPLQQPPSFCLLTFWQNITTPCLSLLADECGLSIIATQHATPIILKMIYYQTIKIAYTPSMFETLLTPFAKNTLADAGINFSNMVILRPKVSQFYSILFSDNASFWASIGIISQRTTTPPKPLAQLTQWLSFLVWQSMAHLQSFTYITTAQLIDALLATDNLPANRLLLDRLLIDTILLDSAIKPTACFYLTPSINHSDSQTLWETHKTALQHYQASQPFAIVPRTHVIVEKPTTTPTRQTLPPTPNTLISYPKPNEKQPTTDIFTKNSASTAPLNNLLQRHWVGFAIGLSALVIGGIGAISANNKPAPDNSPIPTIAPADIPHDVAIVRTPVTSSPASTSIRSKKSVVQPSANQPKTAEKQNMHKKTPDTHQPKDKTKKNPPSTDKKITAKKNTTNDTPHTVKASKSAVANPRKPLKTSEDDD